MFGVLAWAGERLWRSGSRKGLCRAAAAVLFVVAAVPVGARVWFGVIPFLSSCASRRSVDVPGVRHLRLSEDERTLIGFFRRAYLELPPEVRARGVFNYSTDAVPSVILPETKFRHPMFVNWNGDVYPEYPALAMAYILRCRPAVVSSVELELPGYAPVFSGELYGRKYFFYSPVD